MSDIKVGDIVARKSYGFDIFFKVVDINLDRNADKIFKLKGICYRIEADAPSTDLLVQTQQRIKDHNMRNELTVDKKYRQIHYRNQEAYSKKYLFRNTSKDRATRFSSPGKVLHLDGDNEYLQTCIKEYEKLNIKVIGKYVPESEQASVISSLLNEHRPDILVLTGHDGMIKGKDNYSSVENYRNSKHFIKSVKEARKYDSNLDNLVIFAGACQSMYLEILKAGANFASSPKRVLIHALDPVLVCEKVSFSSASQLIEPSDVITNTITGVDGIGGLQTRGKYREGYPKDLYF